MDSDITLRDLISDISILPLNKGNLAAKVSITIADAIIIHCLLRKIGDTYEIVWPYHQDKRTLTWYKDVEVKGDNDDVLTNIVIGAYAKKLKRPASIICNNEETPYLEEDPFK